jgi:hypothetical protein
VDPDGHAGAVSDGGDGNRTVADAEAVVISAFVGVIVPGHQARYQPFATVARTALPSLRSIVTAVTPAPVRPSTSVNALPPASRLPAPASSIRPGAMPPGAAELEVEDIAIPLPLRHTALVVGSA